MNGILAQLGEHLPYKQRVIGSSPIGPISLRIFNMRDMCGRFARVLKVTLLYYGEIAQLARAYGSYP